LQCPVWGITGLECVLGCGLLVDWVKVDKEDAWIRSSVRPPEHAGRLDISFTFRIPTRAGAYRMIVTVQLPDGGRFAREAVIEPERSALLGFCMRQRNVPGSTVLDDAMQCIQAEAATMIWLKRMPAPLLFVVFGEFVPREIPHRGRDEFGNWIVDILLKPDHFKPRFVENGVELLIDAVRMEEGHAV
jgi:hypothetical protein